MKFQFLPENFSRSENAPPFETRKIRLFEVERIFLKNKKMLDVFGKPLCHRKDGELKNTPVPCPETDTGKKTKAAFIRLEK